jgi:hypothetical protein
MANDLDAGNRVELAGSQAKWSPSDAGGDLRDPQALPDGAGTVAHPASL